MSDQLITKEQPHSVNHFLDSYLEYFEATINKMKTHELRLTTLGPFSVGDVITLKEFDDAKKIYTGRTADVVVTYISPNPEPWLVPGYTLMSTRLADPTKWYLPGH